MVPNVVFVPVVTLLGIMGATAWQMSNKSAAAKEDEEAKEDEKQRKDQSSSKTA
jgi:flagellar basal body-associated protein FliL